MNHEKIPVLAGSGRSGTTWILDALATANERRTIFEPLHPACVKGARKFSNLYVPVNSKNPDLSDFFNYILSGKKLGTWVDYRVRTDRIVLSTERFQSPDTLYEWYCRLKKLYRHKKKYKSLLKKPPIIKIIRGNLLLGWLTRNFSVNVVLIVRHPGAVIESMKRLGGKDWKSESALQEYRKQSGLISSFSPKIQNMIATAKTDNEKHMLVWCIENSIPISIANDVGIKVVYYENLLLNPDVEWKLLVDSLGLKKIPEKTLVEQPSQQASPGKKSNDYTKEKLARWMSSFSHDDNTALQNILDQFHIGCYRMDDPLPVKTNGIAS